MCLIRLIKWLPAYAIVALGLPEKTAGQAPGIPVLQNAFSNPGLAVAVNMGGGGGESFLGAAAAWGLGGGRLQLSGAAGASRANGATRASYGGRLAASVWTSSRGSLGVGAFGGLGGAPRTRTASTITNPALAILPVGLTVGYRRPMGGGTSRGISAYASPFYRWVRATSDTVSSSGAVRVSLGLDFAFSPAFGATVGAELGQSAGGSRRGGSGSFGGAVSFVPGRR